MTKYYVIKDSQGKQYFNRDNVMHIGQTDACEVRLPNESQYEDAVLAVIVKRDADKGWKLIRMSPYKEHEVRVNGMPVENVHLLNEGDRIDFEGQKNEFTFSVRDDDTYNASGIVMAQGGNKVVKIWMIVMTLGLLIFGLGYYYNQPITSSMINRAKTSTYRIVVDSVKLVKVQNGVSTVLESCAMSSPSTIFLTDDSLLVTARHSIEPWLNVSDRLQLDTISDEVPRDVKMALKAVTNEILGDGSYELNVVSVCSIYQIEPEYKFLFGVESSDFVMDKSRDNIKEYGDYDHLYYWRSISASLRNNEMMMGDFAFIPTKGLPIKPCGTIHVARVKDFQKMAKQDVIDVVMLGYPSTMLVKENKILTERGELKNSIELDENGYVKQVIAHNGDIVPGYSGGPVLTKQGFRWYAIGVVSVTDKYVNKRFYSVPVIEIERMKTLK